MKMSPWACCTKIEQCKKIKYRVVTMAAPMTASANSAGFPTQETANGGTHLCGLGREENLHEKKQRNLGS